MTSSKKGLPVPGSERAVPTGARMVGKADPKERILVTVVVRRRSTSQGLAAVVEEQSARAPQERRQLTHEEFAAAYGADPADLEKVEEFAHEHGLDVVEISPGQAPPGAIREGRRSQQGIWGFPGTLQGWQGNFRGRTGPVRVPEELAPIIEGVFGLDNRPQAKTHAPAQWQGERGQPRAGGISYTPPQIAKLYDFPSGSNGKGQCIAIIELGGGYRTTDLKIYFSRLGIPTPAVKARSVDGGHDHPRATPMARAAK